MGKLRLCEQHSGCEAVSKQTIEANVSTTSVILPIRFLASLGTGSSNAADGHFQRELNNFTWTDNLNML